MIKYERLKSPTIICAVLNIIIIITLYLYEMFKFSSMRYFIAQCRPNSLPLPPSLVSCSAPPSIINTIIAREIYGCRGGPARRCRLHASAYRHRRSPRLWADRADEKISPTDLGTAAAHTRV